MSSALPSIGLSRRSLLFGAGVAVLGLSACGGSGSKKASDLSGNREDAMDSFGVGQQFKATAPLTITTLYSDSPAYAIKSDWLFWTELAKRTNVTLKPTVVPASDYTQKVSLIVGGGDAPFIIPKTYPGQEVPFVASGAVLPVSDYLDLMPNFQDKVKRWSLEADLDTLRQADGRFYLLPGLHQEIWVDYTFAVRTDILAKLGLKTPETVEDLLDVMRAMKKAYPDTYPMSDRWGVPTPGGSLLNVLAQAWNTRGGWGYSNANWDASAKTFVFTGASDGYKQLVSYLNTMVKEGLLDPESFTQQDDQAIAKFTSGKSFIISTNAQTLVNDYRPALTKAVPGATVAKIPVPVGPSGTVKSGSRLENGIMISKKARDSKDFVALMQFIDWLWYSDEGEVFAKWGVQGTTYTGDAASGFHLAPDVDYVGLNPKASKHLQRDFGFSNGNFAYGGSTALLQSTFSAEELAFQKVMNARTALPVAPPYPMTADEQEQANLWDTPLKDYVTQNTLKFILGQRPLSEWDAYVAELKGKNSDSYLKLVNQAATRFQQKQG